MRIFYFILIYSFLLSSCSQDPISAEDSLFGLSEKSNSVEQYYIQFSINDNVIKGGKSYHNMEGAEMTLKNGIVNPNEKSIRFDEMSDTHKAGTFSGKYKVNPVEKIVQIEGMWVSGSEKDTIKNINLSAKSDLVFEDAIKKFPARKSQTKTSRKKPPKKNPDWKDKVNDVKKTRVLSELHQSQK